MKRLFLFILCLTIGLWAHPLLACALICVLIIGMKKIYFESLFLGILFDIAYQTFLQVSVLSFPAYTSICLGLLLLGQIIRQRLSFHV